MKAQYIENDDMLEIKIEFTEQFLNDFIKDVNDVILVKEIMMMNASSAIDNFLCKRFKGNENIFKNLNKIKVIRKYD